LSIPEHIQRDAAERWPDAALIERDVNCVTFYGWFHPEQGEWYQAQIARLENATIVEVGVFAGLSISYILETCRANGNVIHAIDPWAGELEPHMASFVDAVERSGYSDIVRVVRKSSVAAASAYKSNSIDFIFIDADHSYESVLEDMNLWYDKLKPGSIMAGHDYDFEAVQEAVRTFARTMSIDIQQFHAMWYLAKPTRVRHAFRKVLRRPGATEKPALSAA
jgi:predicted O-methyltransferase YrrM